MERIVGGLRGNLVSVDSKTFSYEDQSGCIINMPLPRNFILFLKFHDADATSYRRDISYYLQGIRDIRLCDAMACFLDEFGY